MRTQQNPRATTFAELAILASSVGLVENSEAGRQAFTAWLAKDQKTARKELFAKVNARRVAASAAKAKTAQATQYPAGWLRAAGVGARAPQATVAPNATNQYPRNWLRGTAIPGPRGTGPRVVEAGD